MRKSAFNLVEILVAMAILTIGMVGLVGIIPVSTEALASANGKLYAAEIGQFMCDYVSADCDGLTDPTATQSPATKLGQLETSYILTPAGSGVLTKTAVVTFSGGAYKLSLNKKGLYIVEHLTKDVNVVDFTAFVNLHMPTWPTSRSVQVDVNWPALTSANTPQINRASGRSVIYYRTLSQ